MLALMCATRLTTTSDSIRSEERLQPGLRTAQDKGMDVMGAFVGVHHLYVNQATGHAEFVGNAVSAQHVASQASNIPCLAARVAFHDRRNFDRRNVFVFHAPQPQAAL